MIGVDSKTYERLINDRSKRLTNDSTLIASGEKRFGKSNLWKGVSGFSHQIDVSLHNKTDALLVECKAWNSDIRAIEFLTLFGRLCDVQANPQYGALRIRAAIVTTKRWQSGVTKLVTHYASTCSVFVVNDKSELVKMIHQHFLGLEGIPSEETFGTPTIIQV